MHFKILSAICFNLDQSKILLSSNGLMLFAFVIAYNQKICMQVLVHNSIDIDRKGKMNYDINVSG